MDTNSSLDIFEKVNDGLERCGDLYLNGKVYPYTVTFAEKSTDSCIENTNLCQLCISTDSALKEVVVEFDKGWKVAPKGKTAEQLVMVLCECYDEAE